MRVLSFDSRATGVAARDGEILLAVIDQDHLDLTAIVGIDGPWRVQHRHAMLRRKPRAGAYLYFVPFRDRDRETGGNNSAAAVRDHKRLCGANIHAGRTG